MMNRRTTAVVASPPLVATAGVGWQEDDSLIIETSRPNDAPVEVPGGRRCAGGMADEGWAGKSSGVLRAKETECAVARITVTDNGRGAGVTTDEHSAGMSSGSSPVEMSLLATARVSALQARAGEQSSPVVKLESAYSWSAGGESVSKGRHAEGGSGRIRRNRGGGIRAAGSRIGGTIRGIGKADEMGCCGSGTNARIRELADAAINPRPHKGGAVTDERTPGDTVVATDP